MGLRSICGFGLLFFLGCLATSSLWFAGIRIDAKERFSNRDSISWLSVQLSEKTGRWTFDFDCHLIGLDVSDSLIKIDPLSFLFDELSNYTLCNGVSDVGQGEDLFWIKSKVPAKEYLR